MIFELCVMLFIVIVVTIAVASIKHGRTLKHWEPGDPGSKWDETKYHQPGPRRWGQ